MVKEEWQKIKGPQSKNNGKKSEARGQRIMVKKSKVRGQNNMAKNQESTVK